MRTNLSLRPTTLPSPNAHGAAVGSSPLRRSFTSSLRLFVSSSLLPLLLLSPAFSQPPTPKINHPALVKLAWQLACQTSTFHEMTFTDMTEMLHAMTIHHLELALGQVLSPDHPDIKITPDMTDADQATFLAVLKTSHLDVVSIGPIMMPNDDKADRKIFAFAKKLKAKNIVALFPDLIAPSNIDLRAIDKLTSEYNVNIACTCGFSQFSFGGIMVMGPQADFTGLSPHIGMCLNTTNFAQCSSAEAAQSLQMLKGRLIEVQLTDLDNHGKPAPFGAGTVPANAILQELADEKFKGVFAVQYTAGDVKDRTDPFVHGIDAFSDIVTTVSGVKE